MTRVGSASAGAVAFFGGFIALRPLLAPVPDGMTAVAAAKPFVETLVETGTVSAARLMLYAAPVGSGPSKIVELVAEGTSVLPGETLVRFDVSAVEAALHQEQVARTEALSLQQQAHEALRLIEIEAAGALEEAQVEVESAERRAANERDGLGRLTLEETRAAEEEAGREEARASTSHADIAALLAEGFVTRAEVERAEQAHRRAQEALRLASLKRELLARFERPAAVARANAELRSATRAVTQARERAGARVAQHRSAAVAAAAVVQAADARIAALQGRLAQSTLRADTAGIAVYRELFFGSDRRKPQVGDEVWPNQPLVALPASDSFIIDTEIREIDLYKIHAKQTVRVTLDAYPDVSLRGEVALVGSVARSDPSRVGSKRFPVTVRLLDVDDRLRIGMTARAEVGVQALPTAIIVPVEAVFEDRGAAYCVVHAPNGPTRRFVRVGGRNAIEAAIVSGLSPGEIVYRADPTAPAPSTAP